MTVMRDSHGVVRGGGVAGWALLPAQEPEGGWPLRPTKPAAPRPAVVQPEPAPVVEPEPVDELVALAASLNDGGRLVYFDRRNQSAGARS
ncbi:hypothetical protein ACLQ2E_35355 [Streptomyces lavendulocolor]